MSSALQPAMRRKSPEAFRSISEAAIELDVPQHVLRFWESRFNQVRPIKRAGGRRFYRPEDVDLLRGIRALLYAEGYTIKGVQKVLRDRGMRHVAEIGRNDRVAPRPDDLSSNESIPQDSNGAALATLARVHVDAEQIPGEVSRPRLEQLLAELQQLKSKLRAARARIA